MRLFTSSFIPMPFVFFVLMCDVKFKKHGFSKCIEPITDSSLLTFVRCNKNVREKNSFIDMHLMNEDSVASPREPVDRRAVCAGETRIKVNAGETQRNLTCAVSVTYRIRETRVDLR